MTTRTGRISELAAEPFSGREGREIADTSALSLIDDGILPPGLASPDLMTIEAVPVADAGLNTAAETQAMLALAAGADAAGDPAHLQFQARVEPDSLGPAPSKVRPGGATHRKREDRP